MKKILFAFIIFLGFSQCKTKSSGVNRHEDIQEESHPIDLRSSNKLPENVNSIMNTQWQAIEIMGNKIDKTLEKSSFLSLNLSGKFDASGGCNSIKGSFQLDGKNRIRFSNFGMTKEACGLNHYDTEFIEALKMTQQFIIREDELQLIVGKRAPLAKFKAIESE